MLLRFRVSNSRSFRKRQELSLVASSLKDREEGLIACRAARAGHVLPAALVFGPNGSGKTNLLGALMFMMRAVTESQERRVLDTAAPGTFRLDPACAEAPSRYEVDFMLDGVLHNYGFEATGNSFGSEWLHDFPRSRARLLFKRSGNIFVFGRSLHGRNKAISESTRPDSLFLSVAAQMSHERLSRIFEYFTNIHGIPYFGSEMNFMAAISHGSEVTKKVVQFLNLIDRNIIDFQMQEIEVDKNEFDEIFGGVYQEAKSQEQEGTRIPFLPFFDLVRSGKPVPLVQLAHRGMDGRPIYFGPGQESAGTLRLMAGLALLFQSLDRGSLFLVDELDASLHTQAAEAVLALFCSPETNPRGAQLIATTHDTNLLNSSLMRRDQVWFTEKGSDGATELYPLTDIRTRKGDDLEKAYLQGRYGAVPSDDLVADLG